MWARDLAASSACSAPPTTARPASGTRGLAAANEREREAARSILAGLTLRHIYDRPLTSEAGHVDEVMRVNYDIDLAVFADIADLTIGALKNRLLRARGAEIKNIGRGLTAR